jgi:hypothetical protein
VETPGNLKDDILKENQSQGGEGEFMEVRRSKKALRSSTRLKDNVIYLARYHIENFISYENISGQHEAYLISILKEQEPTDYHEAIANSNWPKALREELKTLK